jgi:3-phosphoshikimate 1-carboxyvinyltransferase
MKIARASSMQGTVRLPGDKSISHRAAMIAAMADGVTTIDNFALSSDCRSTLDCLAALGVRIEQKNNTVTIYGLGRTGFSAPVEPLDCYNSGTTMRLMAGILAGQDFSSVLTGDVSLRSRPMQRIIDPLTEMGALIDAKNGHPPLSITGTRPLTAIRHLPSQASAPVKSCVLLAGLNAEGETRVIEQVRTRDHTERLLKWFGADVRSTAGNGQNCVSIEGGQNLSARDVAVPADLSSAAFFIAAAVCLAGSGLTLPDVGLNPTRRSFVDILIGLGFEIGITDEREVCGEPAATILVRHNHGVRPQGPLVIEGEMIAGLIDEIPILAILGTQIDGGIDVRDAAELRVKESDRIAAIVGNLRRMGADVTETAGGFRAERAELHGAEINSYGDHRIAMAFTIAGLLAKGETTIKGASCIDVSFPGFLETLRSVIR